MAGFSKTIFNEEPLLTTLFPGDSVVSVLVKAMVVETKVETATERNFILIFALVVREAVTVVGLLGSNRIV